MDPIKDCLGQGGRPYGVGQVCRLGLGGDQRRVFVDRLKVSVMFVMLAKSVEVGNIILGEC